MNWATMEGGARGFDWPLLLPGTLPRASKPLSESSAPQHHHGAGGEAGDKKCYLTKSAIISSFSRKGYPLPKDS